MVAGIAITMRHLPFEAYLIEGSPRHPSWQSENARGETNYVSSKHWPLGFFYQPIVCYLPWYWCEGFCLSFFPSRFSEKNILAYRLPQGYKITIIFLDVAGHAQLIKPKVWGGLILIALRSEFICATMFLMLSSKHRWLWKWSSAQIAGTKSLPSWPPLRAALILGCGMRFWAAYNE